MCKLMSKRKVNRKKKSILNNKKEKHLVKNKIIEMCVSDGDKTKKKIKKVFLKLDWKK